MPCFDFCDTHIKNFVLNRTLAPDGTFDKKIIWAIMNEKAAAWGVLLPADSPSKVYERQQEQAIARSKRN